MTPAGTQQYRPLSLSEITVLSDYFINTGLAYEHIEELTQKIEDRAKRQGEPAINYFYRTTGIPKINVISLESYVAIKEHRAWRVKHGLSP